MYDSWGNKSVDVEAEPSSEPLAARPRKSASLKLSGFMRPVLLGGGVLGAIAALSLVSSLWGGRPRTGELVSVVAPPTPEASPEATPPPKPNDLRSLLEAQRGRMRGVCGQLLEELTKVEEELTQARGDSWRLHAKQQCDREKKCVSSQHWLSDAFVEVGADLQAIAPNGQLSPKALATEKFRKAAGAAKDILDAGLNSPQGKPFILSADLNNKIDDCARAWEGQNSLKEAIAQQVEDEENMGDAK